MSDEPVIIILDDEPVPDPIGNYTGLIWFVLAFMLICFVVAWIVTKTGSKRKK